MPGKLKNPLYDDPEEEELEEEEEEEEEIEEEEELEEEEDPSTAPPAGTRRDRRNNRLLDYRGQVAAKEDAEKKLEEERARRAEVEQRVARLEGAMMRPAAPQKDLQEEYKEKRAVLRQRQEHIQAQYRGLPEDQQASRREELQAKFDDVEDEVVALQVSRNRPPTNEQAVWDQQARQVIEANKDIMENEEARKMATERWTEAKRRGYVQTPQLGAQIFDSVRRDMKMPLPFSRRPSSNERARYGGIAARGGSRGQGRVASPLSRDEKLMATATYPSLDEKRAYAKFRKEVLDS